MEKINALSIDLEEWYHSELVEGRRSSFSQVEEATIPILDLLDCYQTKASFFIVGEVAEQNPRLIQSIFQRAHLLRLSIEKQGARNPLIWTFRKIFSKTE